MSNHAFPSISYVKPLVAISVIFMALSHANAKDRVQDEPVIPNNIITNDINKDPAASLTSPINTLPKNLPESNQSTKMSKEQAFTYLQSHPEELESFIANFVSTNNAPALKDLLPIYKNYPKRDDSLIDWGNAIIATDSGNTKRAVALYRKLNAALPNNKMIQFQLAGALYQDKQFKAAKAELIKLRSGVEGAEKQKVINQYIEVLDHQNDWNINVSVNFLNDKNLNNAPPLGTKLGDETSSVTYTTPRQTGEGLGFSVGGDKKWDIGQGFFTALHLNTGGSYYWNNKKYDDISAGAGVGLGYQNAKTEFEVSPTINQRWYAGGYNSTTDADSLKKYTRTNGVNISLNQWLNQHWLFQNFNQFSKIKYEQPYQNNDGTFKLFSNTLVYLPNSRTSLFAGLDYLNKNDVDDSESFVRKGVRIGWGQAWDKGISTRLNVGIANKNYDAEDFFGIQRKNKEYSFGASIWKRDWYLLGLTPRLTWDYTKVNSNSAFEKYNKSSLNVILTKTF